MSNLAHILNPNVAKSTPFVIRSSAANALEVYDTDNNLLFAIEDDGTISGDFTLSVEDSPLELTGPVNVADDVNVTGDITATGTAGITGAITGASLTTTGKVKANVVGNTANAAPADGAVATSELVMWFDNTNGAGKVMFKGKTANGTVVVGEVALT